MPTVSSFIPPHAVNNEFLESRGKPNTFSPLNVWVLRVGGITQIDSVDVLLVLEGD